MTDGIHEIRALVARMSPPELLLWLAIDGDVSREQAVLKRRLLAANQIRKPIPDLVIAVVIVPKIPGYKKRRKRNANGVLLERRLAA